MSRNGDWMQTYLGLKFWPVDPRPEEVSIVDIAHALACQCRYGGHSSEFYSVAQHSLIVSHIVPAEHAKWGLLHDAAEAYLVDLPRPIKRFSALGNQYKHIEERLMACICQRFGLEIDEPSSVKEADNIALMTEKRDLMPNSPDKWAETAEPLEAIISPMSWVQAKRAFLERFGELGIN